MEDFSLASPQTQTTASPLQGTPDSQSNVGPFEDIADSQDFLLVGRKLVHNNRAGHTPPMSAHSLILGHVSQGEMPELS